MTTTMMCAAHPDVETGLTCSRCGTPICPRCMVQTPVGARCRTCARLRRPPMYQIAVTDVAKGVIASAVLGAVLGAIWGYLLPGGLGIFIFFLAFFVGPPIGYFFADALGRVTNRKRGPVMQWIAVGGLVLAFLVHGIVGAMVRSSVLGSAPFQADIGSLIITAAACVGAYGRLR